MYWRLVLGTYLRNLLNLETAIKRGARRKILIQNKLKLIGHTQVGALFTLSESKGFI